MAIQRSSSLDEPTVGLDPIQIIDIRNLIRDLGKDHTVIFSSHILSEVQTICDQILIIAGGKLIAFDKPENLEKQLLSREIVLVSEGSAEEAAETVKGLEHVTEVQVEYPEAQETGFVRASKNPCPHRSGRSL